METATTEKVLVGLFLHGKESVGFIRIVFGSEKDAGEYFEALGFCFDDETQKWIKDSPFTVKTDESKVPNDSQTEFVATLGGWASILLLDPFSPEDISIS